MATTTITNPMLNRRLDKAVEVFFRNSGRKGDRKTVAEYALQRWLDEQEARGWFEDPDAVEGLTHATESRGAA